MLSVRDVMTRELVFLEPEHTLRQAIQLLQEENVAGAPVLAGTRLVGVVSMRDILAFELTAPGVPTERNDSVSGEALDVVELPEEMSDGQAAYYRDMWSDAGADVTERFSKTEGPEWDRLEEHTVSEVMTRGVIRIGPGASVRDAAQVMVDRGVHRLLVTRDGDLEGLVSASDIVRAVAEDRI